MFIDMGLSPEGYGARSTIEPTQVDTGHIFEDPDQDYHVRHPIKKSWKGPPPYFATVTPAAAIPGVIPQEISHLQQLGIQYCAGHPCGTDWQLGPNDSDGDQNHRPVLFLQ